MVCLSRLLASTLMLSLFVDFCPCLLAGEAAVCGTLALWHLHKCFSSFALFVDARTMSLSLDAAGD